VGKALTAVLVATGIVLGNAAIVAAADFCVAASGTTFVLKAFALPGKGICKETRGFYIGSTFWTTGMACGSSDRDHITFFQTGVSDGGTVVFTDKFTMDRTTLSGPGVECALDTGSGGTCLPPTTYTKIDCTPKTVPVP
jgi:hypothetical protein